MEQFENLIKKEEQIAHGEMVPKNRNQLQIYLAVKLVEKLTGEAIDFEDHNQRDDAIIYWKEKGYAKAFADLEESDVFKNSLRLKGNIFDITVDDVKSFLETGELPIMV